jgi:hypothetical protein
MAEVDVGKELQKITREIERMPKTNGPEQVRQGVAEDLATFIEKHAEEMLKEAQQHLAEAQEFAKEIRQRTADQINKLRAYTDSIKEAQTRMAEVRMNFLNAGTTASTKE